MKIIDSVCSRDCYDTCFMKVYVEDNVVKKLKEALKTLLLREYFALEAMQILEEYIA